jgi:ABC-2 type transport system permease protein
MSATVSEFLPASAPTRASSNFQAAWNAFWSLVLRDILVTWRELISFLIQVILQPMFMLFIMGRVLPGMGEMSAGFGTILLPGILAFTVFLTALQGVSFVLILDLGYSREIEDRLLAPLPISMVAIEKVLVAMLRGWLSGIFLFPLAWWILGNSFQVRTDMLGGLIAMVILTSMVGAALGLVLGTAVQPEQIGIVFGLVLTPLIFTACVYNPWGTINIQWFKIVALFNPLTYVSEGLRATMLPASMSHAIPTLGMGWILLVVGVSFVVFLAIGMRTFRSRVVS